ncbi:fungal-specific transcription factor domain-containing protein [Xylogone sp. PMI_703]|nr:fungal-specific transcription factor domain-containing protein [Xylogone sp. PMI_703]
MVSLPDVQTSNALISTALPPGLVALFVGATSGIGEITLKKFAKYSVRPRAYFIGRSQDAADRIVAECRTLNPAGEYTFIKADVSLIRVVDDICKEIKSKEKSLNLLFLSAGLPSMDRSVTSEQLHVISATNYYSRLRFITNLLPLIQHAPSLRRVVVVAAGGKEGPIDPTDFPALRVPILKVRGHLGSMITLGLEAVAKQAPDVSFIHDYPGTVNTTLISRMGGLFGIFLRTYVWFLGRWVCVPIEECGERHLYLATSARFAPTEDGRGERSGVPLGVGIHAALKTTEGSDGVYSVGWDCESAPPAVRKLLAKLREDGTADAVWRHTEDEFKRITDGAQYIRRRTRKEGQDKAPARRGQVSHSASSTSSQPNISSERDRGDQSPILDAHLKLLPNDRLSKPFGDAKPDADEMFYLHIAAQSVKPKSQPITDTEKTLFLGESFSLTYVVHDVLAPFLSEAPNYQKRLHFPISDGYDPSDRGRQTSIDAQVRLLQERNILYQLEDKALERLLLVYFRWFHPAFPVLNQNGFIQRCLNKEMSLLVLNSVLMIAVTMCSEYELGLTKIASRYDAREIFYRQARALYDSDLDSDKVNNVISLFLISFWWGGPNDEKDSWHWLGIAISLAQSLGMHRSTSRSNMSSHTARHWRRIWWSLRVRDALTSGSIGRPQHFSVNNCDVEVLEPDDIKEDHPEASSEEIYYACQMARLSTIFSDILSARYPAVSSASQEMKLSLENALDSFRAQIPSDLKYERINAESGQGLWAAMLMMAYNFAVILLCRPSRSIDTPTTVDLWGNASKALIAANDVSRIMEDILSVFIGRLCQIHTIPALFNSLAMHVYSMCTSGVIGRELAENRARTCMLGLSSLQESWPVSGWILKLFVDIMERLKSKLSNNSPLSANRISETQGTDEARFIGPYQSTGYLTPRRYSEVATINSGEATPTTLPNPSIIDKTEVSLLPLNEHAFLDYGLFPNMFMLDQSLQDPQMGQVDFFDLLRVPDWDSLDQPFK